MKKNLHAISAGLLCCSIISPAAHALEIDADLELDMLSEESVYTTSGRVQINVSSETKNGDNFVSAKASAMQNISGDPSVDDAWIKMGSSKWAVQIGRFEANNLFPLGKDTYVASTGVTGYQGNVLRGRLGGNGIAFTTSFSDSISVELDSAWGDYDNDDTNTLGDKEKAFNGFRPSITYSVEGYSLSVGFENVKMGDTDISGSAITVNFDAIGGNINVSYAAADDNGTDRSSANVNYTAGNFGIGVLSEDDSTNTGTSTYVAYTMPLLGVEGASITGAASSGEDVSGVKVRFNYAF
jgi:hypothetical protein